MGSFKARAHESAAGFMASVVGEMTGVPGVCVSTVGPGATNLATGVGAAWLDCGDDTRGGVSQAKALERLPIQRRLDSHPLGPAACLCSPGGHPLHPGVCLRAQSVVQPVF